MNPYFFILSTSPPPNITMETPNINSVFEQAYYALFARTTLLEKENKQLLETIEKLKTTTEFKPLTFRELVAQTEIKAIAQIFPQSLSPTFGIHSLKDLFDIIANFQNITKTERQTLFESKLSNIEKEELTHRATLFRNQYPRMTAHLEWLTNIFMSEYQKPYCTTYTIYNKTKTLYWIYKYATLKNKDERYPKYEQNSFGSRVQFDIPQVATAFNACADFLGIE